ncbi:CoA ester lyase [Mycobacterium sp. CBMA271]|nr:CoA ester lyase [Mycobacteroides sp. CBMA 271]
MTLANIGPGWLFCPADRPERFEKASVAADVVILDLEDGVADTDRPAARDALINTPLDPTRTVVRLNPAGTADHLLDVEAIARTAYTTVMLAKSEHADQVIALAPLDVVVLVETPLGALNVVELVRPENAVAAMWGAEDLFAATWGTDNRWPDGRYRDVAQHVRSQTLLAAKAFGRMALDSVYLDIKGLDRLRAEADDAVAVGFDAKVAIHPTQVSVIREAYRPTEERVRWARGALELAGRERGVFQFEGTMVDAPVLRRAERIVELSTGIQDDGSSESLKSCSIRPVDLWSEGSGAGGETRR